MDEFGSATTGRGMTFNDFAAGVQDLAVGRGETFVEAAKSGALASFGLGTAIREIGTPVGAPVTPDAIQSVGGFEPTPTPPIQLEDQPDFEARRAAAKPLSKAEYEASPFYRKAIPWDAAMNPARAEALASWHDAKTYRDSLTSRSDYWGAALAGNLVGQAVDPVNYIPVLGPAAKAMAVERFGLVAGRVLGASVDAAANTALFGFGSAALREKYGDDVSFGSIMLDVGSAALIGAAFGSVHGLLERRGLDRENIAIRRQIDVQHSLEDAAGSLALHGEVRASDGMADTIRAVAREEAPRAETPTEQARTATPAEAGRVVSQEAGMAEATPRPNEDARAAPHEPLGEPRTALSSPAEPHNPDVAAAASRLDSRVQSTPDNTKPEAVSRTAREIAEDHRIDPTTGDFPELADLERLDAAGRILPEERAVLEQAHATLEKSKVYADALRAATACNLV